MWYVFYCMESNQRFTQNAYLAFFNNDLKVLVEKFVVTLN